MKKQKLERTLRKMFAFVMTAMLATTPVMQVYAGESNVSTGTENTADKPETPKETKDAESNNQSDDQPKQVTETVHDSEKGEGTKTTSTETTTEDGTTKETIKEVTEYESGAVDQVITITNVKEDEEKKESSGSVTSTEKDPVKESEEKAVDSLPEDIHNTNKYELESKEEATDAGKVVTNVYTDKAPIRTEVETNTIINEDGSTTTETYYVETITVYKEVITSTGEKVTTEEKVYKLLDSHENEISTGNDNINEILSYIGNYGVYGNEVTVGNDIESGIAAGTLNMETGSNTVNPSKGGETIVYAENIVCGNDAIQINNANLTLPKGYELCQFITMMNPSDYENKSELQKAFYQAYSDGKLSGFTPQNGQYYITKLEEDGTISLLTKTQINNTHTSSTPVGKLDGSDMKTNMDTIAELSSKIAEDADNNSNAKIETVENSAEGLLTAISNKDVTDAMADATSEDGKMDVLYANVNVTLNPEEEKTLSNGLKADEYMKIYVNEGQTCIVNINITVSDSVNQAETTVDLVKYRLFIGDNEITDQETIANTVFWNVANYEGTLHLTGFVGTLIAPKANVFVSPHGENNGSESEGRVVANAFKNKDCEFHGFNGTVVEKTETTTIENTKYEYLAKEYSQYISEKYTEWKKTETKPENKEPENPGPTDPTTPPADPTTPPTDPMTPPTDPTTPPTDPPTDPTTPPTDPITPPTNPTPPPTTRSTTTTGTPTVTVVDTPTPLAATPEGEVLGATRTIEDSEVPLAVLGADRPQTGDESNAAVYLILLLASCMVLVRSMQRNFMKKM